MAKRSKQQGSALISALLLMSIVTMLSVGMLWRQDLEIRRTQSIFQQDRLNAEASWVEFWAVGILTNVVNQITRDNDYITLEQIWALPLEEFQREGLWISGQIYDLQSLFNLNNVLINNANEDEEEQDTAEDQLAEHEHTTREEEAEQMAEELTPADYLTEEDLYTPAWMFTRLLENQALVPALQARALTETLLYWLLPQETENDDYYLKQPHPYRPAHQPLWSVSEIRLLQGMDNAIYQAIQPFLMVIPMMAPAMEPSSQNLFIEEYDMVSMPQNELFTVNINTTTPQLLMAILDISEADARAILGSRPYYTQESLQEQVNKKVNNKEGGQNALSMLDITSRYFLVRAQVRDERRTLVQYSILHRNTDEQIVVVGRVQGEL